MKNRTLLAVEQQIAAMGCEVYEIGLYKPHVSGTDTREPEMLPRTWDRATLLKSVPWLRYQNSQGRNIYIRPKGEHHLSMVDDLTTGTIKRMKAEGFGPTLVVETSPGNFQAWLNHGQILPQRLSTLAARELAEKFGGDKGAADWRHFGRLAGFTNRKARYQSLDGAYPFVRITVARQANVYSSAGDFVANVRQIANSLENPIRTAPSAHRDVPMPSIHDFRSNPIYSGDGNRIDLAYAIFAMAHGRDEAAISADLRTRDLSKKGMEKRQAATLLERCPRLVNVLRILDEDAYRSQLFLGDRTARNVCKFCTVAAVAGVPNSAITSGSMRAFPCLMILCNLLATALMKFGSKLTAVPPNLLRRFTFCASGSVSQAPVWTIVWRNCQSTWRSETSLVPK